MAAAAGKSGNEAAVSAALARLTLGRLVAQPGLFFSLWPEKLMWSVAPFDWEWFPRRAGKTRSLNLGYFLLLVPAVIGLRRLWTHPRRAVAVVALTGRGTRCRPSSSTEAHAFGCPPSPPC